jgi:phage shock protein PspC (stress-responsive transcriptional regulator)
MEPEISPELVRLGGIIIASGVVIAILIIAYIVL